METIPAMNSIGLSNRLGGLLRRLSCCGVGIMYGGGGSGGAGGAPRLEPKDLFQKRAARDKSRLRAYNEILGQIHNRIYTTSQLPGNTNSLVYTVPPFILGMPAMDLQDCVVYLVTMLRNGGFVVKFTYPNLLYISWKHYEAEYNKQHNPIVQAMMPPEATTKKGKEGKRGVAADAPRSVSFAPVESVAAAPRSAAAYQPPDSFLESLTRSQPAPRPAGGPPTAAQATNTAVNVLADLWKFT